MPVAASANNDLLIPRTAAHHVFRDALRMFVGRGKRYSVKQVSIGTGIAERMIESFMAQVDGGDFRKPDLEEVLTISSFIGPDFTTEMLAPCGQGAFWLPDAEGPGPGELAAETAEDSATVVRAALDSKFERHEAPDLRVAGKRMVTNGAHLVAVSDRLLRGVAA